MELYIFLRELNRTMEAYQRGSLSKVGVVSDLRGIAVRAGASELTTVEREEILNTIDVILAEVEK